jgi:hypothetical protein
VFEPPQLGDFANIRIGKVLDVPSLDNFFIENPSQRSDGQQIKRGRLIISGTEFVTHKQ